MIQRTIHRRKEEEEERKPPSDNTYHQRESGEVTMYDLKNLKKLFWRGEGSLGVDEEFRSY
jgi:hypothetical protein